MNPHDTTPQAAATQAQEDEARLAAFAQDHFGVELDGRTQPSPAATVDEPQSTGHFGVEPVRPDVVPAGHAPPTGSMGEPSEDQLVDAFAAAHFPGRVGA